MAGSRADCCLLSLLLVTSGGAWAEEAAEDAVDDAALLPDMEFLEYLGSWEESDEEWMLFAGEEEMPAERTDPAPAGDTSVESDDER